jgi:hypothetical protein
MSILLITYDLNKPGQDYTPLLKLIKQHASWAKLSESSYAIQTNQTPSAIYQMLAPYVDKNDTLLVITLTSPYYGQASPEVVDWLAKKL